MNRATFIKDNNRDWLANFEDNESDIPPAPFDAWVIPIAEYNKRGSVILEQQQRAEATEARCTDLLERNRELSESVTTLRAERDKLESGIDKAVTELADYSERLGAAQLELQQIRELLDAGTNGNDNSALALVRRLKAQCEATEREAWHGRM